jgi:hypothetical protein
MLFISLFKRTLWCINLHIREKGNKTVRKQTSKRSEMYTDKLMRERKRNTKHAKSKKN